ncbi:MAG TPA: tetratricopeptide repeat protein [Bacteroidales bacterium]|nr:tetratricopeptide repeat protein [Bacteroidales bacterium]
MKKSIIKYLIIIIGILFCSDFSLMSQNADVQLALNYYQNEEYDKAAVIYEKLYNETGYKNYRDYYLRCLTEIKDYNTAETFLKKEKKKNKTDYYLMIDLGMVYYSSNRFDEAEKEFNAVIDLVKTNKNNIMGAASAFIYYRQYSLAEKTYLSGEKLTNSDFSMELGNLFYIQRDYERMMQYYLKHLDKNPQSLQTIQSRLQYIMANDIDESLEPIIESLIIQKIQEAPQKQIFNKLLIWQYSQTGRYKLALDQLIAMDKRSRGGDSDIIEFGLMLFNNNEYDLAMEAFAYIISKGRENSYYNTAYIENLNVMYAKTTAKLHPDKTELLSLEQKLEEALGIVYRKESYKVIFALVNIKAFYLNKFDESIELITKCLNEKRFLPDQELSLKLLLGDIYFLNNNPWDAILTYAQVEKLALESPVGHEARFKKAKLAYYTGQFKWAQAQLDVLKSSTSKLIANDAMELSMFIADNYNLDTTETTMQIFARADFYIFSKQYDNAFASLDSIIELFPSHSLMDDVLFRKAIIYEAGGDLNKAADFYNQVAVTYYYDILSDNALFKYAVLKEKLNDKSAAQEAYLKLISEYPGSIFTVDARKNLRKLSGTQ